MFKERRILSSPKIYKHEKILKYKLNVEPKVYYGKAARKEMEKYPTKNLKWKRANGFYNPPLNEVYIFKVLSVDSIIGILAHELRHVHQLEHKRKDFTFHYDWYGENIVDPFYLCRKTELDANEFAYQYCLENELKDNVTEHYLKKKNKWIKTREKHKRKNLHSCP